MAAAEVLGNPAGGLRGKPVRQDQRLEGAGAAKAARLEAAEGIGVRCGGGEGIGQVTAAACWRPAERWGRWTDLTRAGPRELIDFLATFKPQDSGINDLHKRKVTCTPRGCPPRGCMLCHENPATTAAPWPALSGCQGAALSKGPASEEGNAHSLRHGEED